MWCQLHHCDRVAGIKHGVYGYPQDATDGPPQGGLDGRRFHQQKMDHLEGQGPVGPRLSVQVQCAGHFAEAIEKAAASGKATVVPVGNILFD